MLLVKEDAVWKSQLILELLQSHQILLHFRLKEGRGEKKGGKKMLQYNTFAKAA